MQRKKSEDHARGSQSLNKWSLRFKSIINERGYAEEYCSEEHKIYLFLTITILGAQSIYQLVYEQSLVTISFLVASILLIVGSAFLTKYLAFFILLSQMIGIVICGYRLKYFVNQETNLNDYLQMGQISLCLILQGTGSFLMDIVVQICLIVITIFQCEGLRVDTLYNLIITHVIFLGMKYTVLKKLKIIFVVKSSLNEFLSYINKTLNIDFLMTHFDPITSDLQVYDYNLKFARTTGLTSDFKEFLHQIKLDLNNSEIKEDILQKKEPSLKDYLMQRHWVINELINKKKGIKVRVPPEQSEEQKIFRSSLENIKPSNIMYQVQVKQGEGFVDSPTSSFQKQPTSQQKYNSMLYNYKKQAPSSSIENGSITMFKSTNFRFNQEKRYSDKGDEVLQSNENNAKDSAIQRLRQLQRIDTLYGVHLNEQLNKKIYFKIKVGVIQMDRPFLGITLENQTERREYAEFKGSFKSQLNIFTQSILQMKLQAIQTIKLCRSISASQMVPLLSQINLIDCLQDYLQRREDQRPLKINKQSFNLKNLLKEIEDIFQVSVSIGGESHVQNVQQYSSNNILSQKYSSPHNQGRPQRDSLFAKWKNNNGMVIGVLDIPPFLQQASNMTSNAVNSSKETASYSKGGDEMINANQMNANNVQTDQFIINNDMYRLRQILIAIATNMICWNRALNGKKSSLGEKNDTSFDSNPIELICTEESNQLFEFFKLKFKLFCPHSPFMPREDTLLKYLNGVRDSAINRVCRRMINSNIQNVGPYKLNTSIVDEKYIEISFDIFKNVDIMDNREKGNSFNSQSQIFSHNNCTTPPLTAGRGSVNAANYMASSMTNQKQIQKSFNIYTSKKVKQLNGQNQILYNSSMNNSPTKISHSILNQIDLNQNSEPIPQSTYRQLAESEKFVSNSQDQICLSNINIQYDSSLRQGQQQQQQQQQQQAQNQTYNMQAMKDSIQIYSNSPYNASDCDQSEDLQTVKSPDLNFAIKTFLRNKSPSSLMKGNIRKHMQLFPKRSRSNSEELTDSNISKSCGNFFDENYSKKKANSLSLINKTSKKLTIHTISSVNQNQNDYIN